MNEQNADSVLNCNRFQIVIGVLAILVGSAIYLTQRSPDQTYVFILLPKWFSGYRALPRLPIALSGSLPTFMHALSFSIITGSLFRPRTSTYAGVCILWFLIELAFELGQGPGRWIAYSMPTWMDGLSVIREYFIFGTFDLLDILSAFLGSIAAFLLLILTRRLGQ